MCIEAYLNGNETGCNTHLSLSFIKGKYDPLLKWPFDYKVTVILVDQTYRRHIWHRFQPDHDTLPSNVHSPTAMFCTTSHSSQSYLYSMMDISYVKEDVMYIRCILNIFHP